MNHSAKLAVILFLLFWTNSILLTNSSNASTVTAKIPVDMQMVIAIDVSSSIDQREYKVQKEGAIAALLDANFRFLLNNCFPNKVAITIFEFSGQEDQLMNIQLVPWTIVDGGQSLDDFVLSYENAQRSSYGNTDVFGALQHADALFESSPYQAPTKKLILSADGPQNIKKYFGLSGNSVLEFSYMQKTTMMLKEFSEKLQSKGIDTSVVVVGEDSGLLSYVPQHLWEGEPPSLYNYFVKIVALGNRNAVEHAMGEEDYQKVLSKKLNIASNQCMM